MRSMCSEEMVGREGGDARKTFIIKEIKHERKCRWLNSTFYNNSTVLLSTVWEKLRPRVKLKIIDSWPTLIVLFFNKFYIS